jgi:hypothetical protein
MLRQNSDARRRKALRAEIKEFCPACFRLPLGPLAGAILALLNAFAVVASLWWE